MVFASHCLHLLRLLWSFFLGSWISLIMMTACWWLDVRLSAYSTVLPSGIWIQSVLLLCTTSLRTGPLWAIDSSVFNWAEANSSPSHICRGCSPLIWDCSALIMELESSPSDHLGGSLSSQFLGFSSCFKWFHQNLLVLLFISFWWIIQLYLETALDSDLPKTT